jgi:hypothetical protein
MVLSGAAPRCVQPYTLPATDRCFRKRSWKEASSGSKVAFNCTEASATALAAVLDNVKLHADSKTSAESMLGLGPSCVPANSSKSMTFTFSFPMAAAPSSLAWGVKIRGFLPGAITSYTLTATAFDSGGKRMDSQTLMPKWPTSATMDMFRW